MNTCPRMTTKIDAVKAIRYIQPNIYPAINPATGQPIPAQFMIVGLGLKESKDLVEAIGRLAVREFLSDPATFIKFWGDPRTDVKE